MNRPWTPVQIRNYRTADFARLHQIDGICFPPDVAYSRLELLCYLRHPDSIGKVAEWSGGLVGFVVGRVEKNGTGHVQTLDVIPEARRQRVGTALMEALHGEFERRNVHGVLLEVDVANEGAQRFYEGLSYVRAETLRGYYNGRRDAYRMVRAGPLQNKS